MGVTPKSHVHRREAALELLGLGLTQAEAANVLGVCRQTIIRDVKGCAIPVLDCPAELSTPRARTVWQVMMRERRRTRQEGFHILEARIARIISKAGL